LVSNSLIVCCEKGIIPNNAVNIGKPSAVDRWRVFVTVNAPGVAATTKCLVITWPISMGKYKFVIFSFTAFI